MTTILHTDDLSQQAQAHLLQLFAKWQRSRDDAAAMANNWANGYRAYHTGLRRWEMLTRSAVAGWDYASGENAYWTCIAQEGIADYA